MNPILTFLTNHKIVVEKLTKNVTENHIREIFGGFGEIEYLDLPINKACKARLDSRFDICSSPNNLQS
jgi:RNA-binding protein with serine-rich domain 1